MKLISASVMAGTWLLAATHAAAELGVPSGEYKLDPTHAYITIGYDHMGFSSPRIGFTAFDASLNLDAESPGESELSVTIQVTSVDSRVDEFDAHLVGENWFDAANHPEITFESTEVEFDGDDRARVTGDLTIKGITQEAVLDVELNKAGTHPRYRRPWVGFDATAFVLRSKFDLGAYAPMVSDRVEIEISVEFAGPEG